jgi:glycerophosphoryl diester phosphodiesterase
MEWPKFIAHRGASAAAPENTLESLKIALALGAQCVEFDVQPSHDGKLVVFHDPTLQRSCDMPQRISDCLLSELKKIAVEYQFGAQTAPIYIPSFDDYLSHLEKSKVNFNCEVKCFYPDSKHCATFMLPNIGRLKACGERYLVTSSCSECLALLRAEDKDLAMGIVARSPNAKSFELCKQLNLISISAHQTNITESLLNKAVENNLVLMAYTVNNYEEALRLLEQGVTSIFSDVVYYDHT